MSKPEILEKTPTNIVELKSELKRIKKRDEDLTFRGNKTEEYLNEFSNLSNKDMKELVEKLEGLEITRLKPEFLHKIIDTMPTTLEELKVVLQGYTLSINKEDMKRIMKVLKEYNK